MPSLSFLRVFARSFLAGEPSVEEIVARGGLTLGKRWRWLRPLARRYVKAFAGKTRPRRRDVIVFLLQDPGFTRAWFKHHSDLSVVRALTGGQQMQPVAAAKAWDVPPITSIGALAAWLQLTPSKLEWFADLKGLGYKKSSPQLRHYHYRILAKDSGNIRLIEAPKPRLKELQRQILAQILDKIPPHPAVHGFVKGRSIKTFIAPHVGQRVVLRMDLRDFFPSFVAARIQTFFRTVGYPESVADLLGGVCTNATPRDVWPKPGVGIDPQYLWEARALYSQPHLPQGAPTSPALANLCTYRVDCRLAGLAESVGARYTRYADDIAFSGSDAFEKGIERFSIHVAAILLEEGFTVHHRKTRIMRQGVRQHLAGIVVNQHSNIMRPDFDRLKAILTNCVRLGPESQNRDLHPRYRSHLEGRVGFAGMINPARGKRLRAIFEQIQWQ
ncbi:MAG TPA: reverse transcriptase family protein [Terriglobales bacterium]|jgi:RNA-directed DNA polymerase|nr:reverse transcriptase family protein [Terriglobales bacterium]